MSRILNKEECETAARSLGLSDTSAHDITKYGTLYNRPSGCIFNKDIGYGNNWLGWYDVANDVTCGSPDGHGAYFNCLCKNGKI